MEDEITTIAIRKSTRKRLGKIGSVDDDMDSVILLLLDFMQKHDSKKG